MDLALVHHVCCMRDGVFVHRHLRVAQLLQTLLALTRKNTRQLTALQSVNALLHGLRQVITQVGVDAAQRTQHAGIQRHQHGADAHLADQRATMQRPGAAKGDHREIPRIEPALDRHQPYAPGHALVDNGKNRLGRLLHAQRQPAAQFTHRTAGAFHIQRGVGAVHAALGVDAPEHDVGVGHRRLGSTTAVGHRSGGCPGTARPHQQHAPAVDRCDAAATRADGMHIDHRQAQGNAEIQVGELGHLGLAVDHHRHIKAGATHVGGDDVGKACFVGQPRRGRHTGRRPRAHDVGGSLAKLAQRRHTTVGLHDRHFTLITPARELERQVLCITSHQGLQITLHHARAGALELVVLTYHRGRRHHLPGRIDGQQLGARQVLMCRIGIGVHEGDHHRLDLGLEQRLTDRAQLLQIQWCDNRALVVQPLVDLETQIARHQRLMRALQPVHGGAIPPPELQDVPKPGGGDQCATRALALDHGVGGNRRAMQDGVELMRPESGCLQGTEQPDRRVLRCRRHLQNLVPARRVARIEKVGEGAPDVNTHNSSHQSSFGVAPSRVCWVCCTSLI